MSDDTPTQRFEPTGGDTPTERFDAATPAAAPAAAPASKSRRTLIILIIIGAIFLIAVLVLLGVLLARGAGTPTASGTTTPSATPSETPSAIPTPSATPTPTPTPTKTVDPPPSTNVDIKDFTAQTTSKCDKTTKNAVYVDISWTSVNGTVAYFGVNTPDAETGGMGWMLPASGSDKDFPAGYSPYEFICSNSSNSYTITVVGNGSKQSQTVVVKNTGDKF